MKKYNVDNILKYVILFLLLLYVILKFFINTRYIQQNIVVYCILLVTSLLLTINVLKMKNNRKLNIGIKALIFVGFYYLLFFVVEFIDFCLGISLWNQTERTSNSYDWFEQYKAQDYDDDFNYINGSFI